MSASNSTEHYQLPVYRANDITSYLEDWNGAMQKLDTAIYEASQGGGTSVEVVQTMGTSTTAVMSQKAVTDELAKKANTEDLPAVPNVVQTTGTSTTAVMSQKAVTDVISGNSEAIEGITLDFADSNYPLLGVKVNNLLIIGGFVNKNILYSNIPTKATLNLPDSLNIDTVNNTTYGLGSILFRNQSAVGINQQAQPGIIYWNHSSSHAEGQGSVLLSYQYGGMTSSPFNWSETDNIHIEMTISGIIKLA